MLGAFEEAELEADPERRREVLTFAVIGGGATGGQLAGALAEIATCTMRKQFRHFDPEDARIVLIEGAAPERVPRGARRDGEGPPRQARGRGAPRRTRAVD